MSDAQSAKRTPTTVLLGTTSGAHVGILFDSSPSEPTTLREVVGQAVGAASVCWETPQDAGVFDSTRAKELVDEVVDWVESRYQERPL